MRIFVLTANVLGHFVSVFEKADVEIELQVRLSERIVELISCAIMKKIHARRPGDRRCNAQAKNERVHVVILQHTVSVCVFLLLFKGNYRRLSCAQRFLSTTATASPHKSSPALGKFRQGRLCI